jgi:beta-mannosidase
LWQLASLRPGEAADPSELAKVHPTWRACDGPQPVAAALQASQRADAAAVRDLDADDWWYRCRFSSVSGFSESGASSAGQPARLRFGGLASIADAWLNGRHILRSDNMFVAHTVDVSSILRDDNELILRFHALAPLLEIKRPRPRWRTSLVSDQGLRWIRTSLIGRLASWCPPLAPIGPWRPILIDTSHVNVERTRVSTSLDGEQWIVRISIWLSCRPDASISGTVTVGASSAPLTCERLPHGEHVCSAIVAVPNASLWWPHTHGPQPLYRIRASIAVDHTIEQIDLGRTGCRTIALERGVDGKGFGLLVNGVPVFCRGASWTPLDLTRLSVSRADYRAALAQLRDAGMNMVRVNGTMTYESDEFHDVCDELGILVWQDLMFASMDYPWEDEGFAASAWREAAEVVDSIHGRASLAVVCGSSEVDQQAAMLGLPSARRVRHTNEERVGEIVAGGAPDAIWVPTTPTGGTFPFQVNEGISHYYGIGAYRRPFDDARRSGVRFAAECLAFSNLPERADSSALADRAAWKAGIPRDPGANWDFEDVRDHYVQELFGDEPSALRSHDPERYLALGRVATGEAMARAFAEWRRPGSSCHGGLVWLARDLAPGAGWGVIDHHGRPKPAYWYLKRVLAPVALLCADEGLNGLWLHAVNDTQEAIDGELRVARYLDGRLQGQPATMGLHVPARGSQSLHADALFDGFCDLTYAYRFGPPAHDVVVATLRDPSTNGVRTSALYFPGRLPSAMHDAAVTAHAELTSQGYALVLEAEQFVHAVAIDVDGCVPDDNYLHLEPGEPRVVRLRTAARDALRRGRVSALNGQAAVPILFAEAAHAG